MKYLFLAIVILIIPVSSIAQYRGGFNDGVSLASAFVVNAAPNIYGGGVNDGYSAMAALNQNALPGIYPGGINDGVAFANVIGQNAFPGIYSGGVNDGVALFSNAGQNDFPSIYSGGINDGHAISSVVNQNSVPGLYIGGLADGVAISSVSNTNKVPDIYIGSGNDGYAFNVSLKQNLSVPESPLPVTLLTFAGAWFNDDAVLAWETADEKSLDHFELERSNDAGKSFGYVASVDPNTQSGQHEYRYSDIRAYYLPTDFLLYRLKCIDKNGAFKYSAIVRLNKNKTAPVFVAYPNPTSGRFTLAIMNAKDLSGYGYILSSIDGKIINKGTIRESITTFDLSGQASATYHLFLLRDGKPVQHFTILLTQ